MSIKRTALTIAFLIVFAFVPALPIMWLGETSWAPVWMAYPWFINCLSGENVIPRYVFFFLVVIAAHWGLSFGLATVIDILLFRGKRECNEDQAS